MRLVGQSIDRISVVAHLRCSEDVPQGAEAGAIEIGDAEGVQRRQPLVAGANIADFALSDATVRARAHHGHASNRFDDPALKPDLYTVTVDLPNPITDPVITFSSEGTGGRPAMETGWTARIDGTTSPVRRADYSLQGVAVAPGPHTGVFECVSRTAQAGTVLSVIGFIVCAGSFLVPERVENRRQNTAVHVDAIV